MIAHEFSHKHPEAPTTEHRCAGGCREIVQDKLCIDCAELIVEAADSDHPSSCDCLGCAVWSTARENLNGCALMVARRVLA